MQEFVNGQIDETRILTEVAIFADKADINEEITRLKSHIQQFLKTLKNTNLLVESLIFLFRK